MGENDTWDFYQDKKGEWRWRRTASNGEIVGKASEGYNSRADARKNAERHGYDGNPKGYGGGDKWESYTDKGGKYRWRRRASNGNIVGASSQGYKSASACASNAKRNGK